MIPGGYWNDGDYVFCSQKCRREWQASEREKKEREVKDAGFSSAAEMDAFNRGIIIPSNFAQAHSVITREPETESDPVIQCIHCGAQIPEDSKFCSNCGKTPYPVCPKCGAKISGDPRFCNSCGSDLKKLIIPAGTTVIENEAYNARGLFEAIIPEGVASIGNDAFSYNQLTSVKLPEGLTSIDASAFSYNQLTSVTLPANLVFDKNCFGEFGESFFDYYTKNGKKADTYTYNRVVQKLQFLNNNR
jgi:predicted nucleic acid-binding Zn ribbon protein